MDDSIAPPPDATTQSAVRPTIRPTVPDDIESIYAIITHPAVRAQQYPLYLRSPSDLHWALFQGGYGRPGIDFASGTIRLADKIVGHVLRLPRNVDDRFGVSYGWDLHPDYWGRGIMPAALAIDFAAVFADPRVDEIRVDCFHDNPRCLRVIGKLGCEPIPIGNIDRVVSMINSRCLRWVVRHRLTRERWTARTMPTDEAEPHP